MLQETDGANRLQLPVRHSFCDAPHLCVAITAVVLVVLATVALTQFHLIGASYYAAAGVVGLSAVAVVMTGTHWVCGKRNRGQNLPPDAPKTVSLDSRPPSTEEPPVLVRNLEGADEAAIPAGASRSGVLAGIADNEEEVFQTPAQSPTTSSIREASFTPIGSSTDSEEENVSSFNTPVSSRSISPSPTQSLDELEATRTMRAAAPNTCRLSRALSWGGEKLRQAGTSLSRFLPMGQIPAEAFTLKHYRAILRDQPTWVVPLKGVEPQEGVLPDEVTCYINGEPTPLDIPNQDVFDTITAFGPCLSVLCTICDTAEMGKSPHTQEQIEKIRQAIAVIRKANCKYCFDLENIRTMGRSAIFHPLTAFVEKYFANTWLNVKAVPYVNMGTQQYPHGCSSHLMDVIKDNANRATHVKLFAQFQLIHETKALGYLAVKMEIDLQSRQGAILSPPVQEKPFQRFPDFEIPDVMQPPK